MAEEVVLRNLEQKEKAEGGKFGFAEEVVKLECEGDRSAEQDEKVGCDRKV